MTETDASTSRETAIEPGRDVPLVLFDGRCHLCARSVRFVLRRERRPYHHFAPLESALAQRLLIKHGVSSDIDAIVLVEGEHVYTHSSAALRLCTALRWPWKACTAFLVVPRCIRDAVYRWIAKRRYRWFGQSDTCLVPKNRWTDRFHE